MTVSHKSQLYEHVLTQLESLLPGAGDPVAAMASTVAVLHEALPYSSWTGFYRVVAPDLLRIGPYQGPVGCLEIPFERGVCGAAARSRSTQIVGDVHAFPGHIACDPRSRSEIVVPVVARDGSLMAVLDLDSHQEAAFDAADQEGLEAVVGLLTRHLAHSSPDPHARIDDRVDDVGQEIDEHIG